MNTLSKTAPKIAPKIALGTWSWGAGFAGGDQVFGNHLSEAQMQAVFDAATEAGLNLWDTAAVYGMGSSETALGAQTRRHLQNHRRDSLLISTKFTPQIADAQSATPVADMLAQSCERLGTDHIDLYWVHNPTDVNRWTNQFVPLLKSGKIKGFGVSNHNLEQIKLVNDTLAQAGCRIAAVQNHYSLLYRASEHAGILEYCQANGITFFAYMVLEQGALSGRYNSQNPLPEGSGRAESYNKVLPQLQTLTDAMQQIGARYQANAAQIAIAWAIAKGTLPLIGATKPQHVTDAAAAAAIVLTTEEIATLERLAEQTGVDTKGAWEPEMA
ncbi:aldo/keto reductase [Testudinibacter sp. TR-2022]|uniref:aldo/keto reductase n=1 Tax=Testudinibacter sp. TR-2022 TaxID=2585029 RepID=UPI001117B8C6|nr:aldo/keto reductase [Testudinibacter sp. TR-2022]TNH06997.1 aldo/keto reductase [Pasteurellaceae bacterium Phil11]TNH22864.1 aldo/keto reductase [Testudinibacter sp. TR-2022]TNH25286.1 aldo/keto reductase [Testudinibacter sp. TR-2022]